MAGTLAGVPKPWLFDGGRKTRDMCDIHSRVAWLSGVEAEQEAGPLCGRLPERYVLLGAPGVGKGTQAKLLSASLGACHLSTGDVFRGGRDAEPQLRRGARPGGDETRRPRGG
jgi:hypothetical protein